MYVCAWRAVYNTTSLGWWKSSGNSWRVLTTRRAAWRKKSGVFSSPRGRCSLKKIRATARHLTACSLTLSSSSLSIESNFFSPVFESPTDEQEVAGKIISFLFHNTFLCGSVNLRERCFGSCCCHVFHFFCCVLLACRYSALECEFSLAIANRFTSLSSH